MRSENILVCPCEISFLLFWKSVADVDRKVVGSLFQKAKQPLRGAKSKLIAFDKNAES